MRESCSRWAVSLMTLAALLMGPPVYADGHEVYADEIEQSQGYLDGVAAYNEGFATADRAHKAGQVSDPSSHRLAELGDAALEAIKSVFGGDFSPVQPLIKTQGSEALMIGVNELIRLGEGDQVHEEIKLSDVFDDLLIAAPCVLGRCSDDGGAPGLIVDPTTQAVEFDGYQFLGMGVQLVAAEQQLRQQAAEYMEVRLDAWKVAALAPYLKDLGIEFDLKRGLQPFYAWKGEPGGTLIKIVPTCKHCMSPVFDDMHQAALLEKDPFRMAIAATNIESEWSRVVAVKGVVEYQDRSGSRQVSSVCWQANDGGTRPNHAVRAGSRWQNIAARSPVKASDWIIDVPNQAALDAFAGQYEQIRFPANPEQAQVSQCGGFAGENPVPGLEGPGQSLMQNNQSYYFEGPGELRVSLWGVFADYDIKPAKLVWLHRHPSANCRQEQVPGQVDANGNPVTRTVCDPAWDHEHEETVFQVVPYRNSRGQTRPQRWEPGGGTYWVGRPGSNVQR